METALVKNPDTDIYINSKNRLKVEICSRLLEKPPQIGRCQWLSVVAAEYGKSIPTIRRYEAESRQVTVTAKTGRGTSVWTPEALAWLKGYYLIATKQVGNCSKRGAYRALLTKAAMEDWKIGSEKSAYFHLSKINPMLHKYARGGDRAIDNTFYIIRDLDSLDPFQVVVGDQHIFNWWICDYETLDIYRLQCYLWLDMKTRLPYGIAFDKKYSTSTVKRSLKMGLERFGKFKCTYNDNGRPELSRDTAQVVEELLVYGLKWSDLSELYKTDKGYATLDEKDQILGYTDTPQECKRQNRQIFANVKNAKTKPIERFFDTLETMLLEKALPGMARNLGDNAAIDEQQTLRLKRQREQHLLLSEEEFILQVLKVLGEYENRYHSSLKCSPSEKLIASIKEGWTPERIDPLELKFIFLKKEHPKVINGRIRLSNELYEPAAPLSAEELGDTKSHLLGYEGKKIQVRFDPESPEEAWAVGTDGRVFALQKVKKYQFLNDTDAKEALEWKQHQKKAVRESFKKMTEGIEGTVLTTSFAASIRKAEQKRMTQEEVIVRSKEEIAILAEERIQESRNLNKGTIAMPQIHETEHDRYSWCIDRLVDGYELSGKDSLFYENFTDILDESELMYWENYRQLKQG